MSKEEQEKLRSFCIERDRQEFRAMIGATVTGVEYDENGDACSLLVTFDTGIQLGVDYDGYGGCASVSQIL